MEYSYIILLLPMLMFITLGLCGHKMSHRTAGLLGTSGLFIITILSYIVAAQYFMQPRVDGIYPTVTPYHFEWLRFTEWLHIDLGIMLDPISVMMLVVITTVSSMVHLYSLGYMHGEVGFQRYYAFLSLFTFSMLGLVVASNIFQSISSGNLWACRLTCSSASITPVSRQCRFQESIYRYPLCRPGIPPRYFAALLLYQNFRLRYSDQRRSLPGRLPPQERLSSVSRWLQGHGPCLHGRCR